MGSSTARLNQATRTFWRVTGRPVDLDGDEHWLSAPMHHGPAVGDVCLQPGPAVGDAWLEAAAAIIGGSVRHGDEDAGLLADISRLDARCSGSRPAPGGPRLLRAHRPLADVDIWTQWNPVFQPGGALIARFFGRRVQQLAMPTRPMDVALGTDSRVVPIVDAHGEQQAAGWFRTLRSTSDHVYSGCYSTHTPPRAGRRRASRASTSSSRSRRATSRCSCNRASSRTDRWS